MSDILNDLVLFFGLGGNPTTFLELIVWFVKMCFGCALFRYVLYSLFWLTNSFNKEGRV